MSGNIKLSAWEQRYIKESGMIWDGVKEVGKGVVRGLLSPLTKPLLSQNGPGEQHEQTDIQKTLRMDPYPRVNDKQRVCPDCKGAGSFCKSCGTTGFIGPDHAKYSPNLPEHASVFGHELKPFWR